MATGVPLFECDSCTKIYKQGPIPAICNTFLLKIPKFIFLQAHEAEIRLKSSKQNSTQSRETPVFGIYSD